MSEKLQELKKPIEEDYERKLVEIQKACDDELREARKAYNDMIVKAWENRRVRQIAAEEELHRQRTKSILDYMYSLAK